MDSKKIEQFVTTINQVYVKLNEAKPEPKFHKGQETDKGVIKEVLWCSLGKNPCWGYTMVNDGKVWDENQLTALPKPSITVMLFKTVWKDGKAEVISEDHLIDNLKLKSHDKNYLAKLYFSQGYCAIRIDYGDGHSERRYSPKIEVLFTNSDLGYFLLGWKEIYDSGIVEKELYKIINLKRWEVASPLGVVMRAYKMKDGHVRIFFNKNDSFIPCFAHDPILKALGFSEELGNIMPQILSGKG